MKDISSLRRKNVAQCRVPNRIPRNRAKVDKLFNEKIKEKKKRLRDTNLSLLSMTVSVASSWSGGSAEIPCALCFLGLGFVGVKGDLKGSTLRNLSRWLRSSCISASRWQRSASSSAIFSSLTRSNSCSSRRVPMAVIVVAPVTFEMALWPAAATTATAPCVGSWEASSSSASRCCVDEKHRESKHTRIDTQASPIGTLHLVPSSIQPATKLPQQENKKPRRGARPEPCVVGSLYSAIPRSPMPEDHNLHRLPSRTAAITAISLFPPSQLLRFLTPSRTAPPLLLDHDSFPRHSTTLLFLILSYSVTL